MVHGFNSLYRSNREWSRKIRKATVSRRDRRVVRAALHAGTVPVDEFPNNPDDTDKEVGPRQRS
jgi:hypothetical protein